MRCPCRHLTVLLAVTISHAVRAQSQRYGVVDSIFVGQATGDFDFYSIDAKHHRIYGAGSKVVDLELKRVVGTINDTVVGGGFVIVPEFGRGISRQGIIFDLASDTVISRLHAGGDASTYDPRTRRAFFFLDSIDVIDVRTGTLVTRVDAPGAQESGVSDGAGRIYFSRAKHDSIGILDTRTLKVVGGYSVAPCKEPSALTMDRRTQRLFAACDDQVAIVDAKNGHMVALIPMSGHTDQNAFDPETKLLFMPGGRGKPLTVIKEEAADRFAVVQSIVDPAITTSKIVLDVVTHRVYLPHRSADRSYWYVVLAPIQDSSEVGKRLQK